jgi:glycosyltransferase involved in cell wall biosynthesis
VQIVVNTRLLLRNRLEGMGWFSYQTLKRITQKHKDVHFVFLFDRPYDEEFIFSDNITPLILGPQARHPFLYYAWFHVSVKHILNRLQPDLFLSPDGFLSPGAKCKQLPVIHDINFLHHPKDSKWLTSKYYNRYFPRYARIATRIATVSEYSKKDISEHYKIDPGKIDVVYNGINEFFKPLDEFKKISAQKKFANGCEYFVYAGSIHPRKNVGTLIKAFSEFKKDKRTKTKLVFAGPAAWGLGDIYTLIKNAGVEGEVLFTNRLNNEDMALALGGALAMTFIPYYEGFGIPLVEAMAAEVPIITSNVTSLPEIAGDAALLVNPKEVSEVKNAMIKIHADENLRNSLVEKGKLQREKFSWEKSSELLWDSIQRTVNSH